MKIFEEITKEHFQAWMKEPSNARMMGLIDQYFQLKIKHEDTKSILCFIEGISILAGMAAKDLADLYEIFRTNDRSYNA